MGEKIINNWRDVLITEKNMSKNSDTGDVNIKIEIEAAVESAIAKHKSDYDQKVASCVTELDTVKSKVNAIETAQVRLESEIMTVKTEVQDMKQTQIDMKEAQTENHTMNMQMHSNTAILLQKLVEKMDKKDPEAKRSTIVIKQTSAKVPVVATTKPKRK